MVDIKYKHFMAGLKTPKFNGVGVQIFSAEEVILAPSETKMVKTGTLFEIPEGYGMMVVTPKSVAEGTALRLANSVVVIDGKEDKEVELLLMNSIPKAAKNYTAPSFTLLDGTKVDQDYSKGYLPIGSIVIRKGDCIGIGYLIKLEKMNVSRTAKK